MSQRAYIPHGDHSLDPDLAARALRVLTTHDALDLADMILGDGIQRWEYDPFKRKRTAVKGRPKSGSRHGQ